MFHCDRTGRDYKDDTDGIYDDDEWISWDWINGEIYKQDLAEQFPLAHPEIAGLFDSLVKTAQRYHELTNRYLQIWGELGELFAELKYGIERHKPGTAGSDGRLGDDVVEIKTISPEKGAHRVLVSRKGNFNKLLVVRISDQFEFESRMLDRKAFCKGKENAKGLARVSWQSMESASPQNADGLRGMVVT